mgnify:FL=1
MESNNGHFIILMIHYELFTLLGLLMNAHMKHYDSFMGSYTITSLEYLVL